MEQVMGRILSESRGRGLSMAAIAALCALLVVAQPAGATDAKTFPTPEAAAQALIAAAKSGDKQSILAVLGSDAQDLVSTGDEVQDKKATEKFVTSAEQKMHLEQ